jgi:cobalamin biosynthesis protein CobT
MAKKATVALADIAPAHVNGLKSAIHAVEVQVTILKTMLGIGGTSKASEETEADEDTDSDDEDEEDAKPAKKGKGKPAADDDEDEEDDADEEDESDDEDEEDESDDEDEEDGPTVADAQKALRAFTKKNSREAALKILKKIGKVKDVTEIDVAAIPALIKALGGK